MEVTDIYHNSPAAWFRSNRTEVNHRCGVTRRKPLSARSVSQSDVHLWSFLVDFAMENDGQWPMKVDDLPWIYHDLPWIYHGFTYYSHGNHWFTMETMDLPIISMESRSFLEAFDHFQVDYTELRGLGRCGTWEGEDIIHPLCGSNPVSCYLRNYIYIYVYMDIYIYI